MGLRVPGHVSSELNPMRYKNQVELKVCGPCPCCRQSVVSASSSMETPSPLLLKRRCRAAEPCRLVHNPGSHWEQTEVKRVRKSNAIVMLSTAYAWLEAASV